MQKIIQCKLKDISTESDVEQKFVIPLLVNKAPLGLEYGYRLVYAGLPLVLIEAKKPGEDDGKHTGRQGFTLQS